VIPSFNALSALESLAIFLYPLLTVHWQQNDVKSTSFRPTITRTAHNKSKPNEHFCILVILFWACNKSPRKTVVSPLYSNPGSPIMGQSMSQRCEVRGSHLFLFFFFLFFFLMFSFFFIF